VDFNGGLEENPHSSSHIENKHILKIMKNKMRRKR
jgi:hypothetical protein